MSFIYRGPLVPQENPCSRPNSLFHGRQQELYALTDACLGQETRYYIVYGSGQSGKTSLLLHLRQRLQQLSAEEGEDASVHPCWVDFQRVQGLSFQDLRLYLAKQILKSIPSLRGYEVPKTFGRGGPLFDEWLCDLPFKGRRVVLLLEELGALSKETRQALGDILRALYTAGETRIALVLFGGVELLTMSNEEVSPLHNVCDKIYLSDLSLDESRSVLKSGLGPASDAPECMDEFATMSAAIYNQVAGHPYLTQCIGERVLQSWQKAGRFPLEPAVGEIAQQLSKEDRHFADLHNAIHQCGLVEDCQRLLDHPTCLGYEPAMVKLCLLGVAKRGAGVWNVRNRLLREALKSWLRPTVPQTSSERGTSLVERRVDAVVPSKARVNETIDLFVQVRLPRSPLLSKRDLPLKRRPSHLEHDSRAASFEFPVDPRTGLDGFARLRVRVIAPDFTINDDPEKIILVPPTERSDLVIFPLTAKRQGDRHINVEVLDLGRALLGTVFLTTSVGEVPEQPSENTSSLELTVKVEPPFDVFLSHNSKDKPKVRELKQLLAARGVTVWLDEDELRPGIPWQASLETGIKTSQSVAVLVGQEGLGLWEDEEIQVALRLAVKDKRAVIPVLLPGAPDQPSLPLFLGSRAWVDLRSGFTEEGLAKLVWGITGEKPSR
jgi:hypothetical protein